MATPPLSEQKIRETLKALKKAEWHQIRAAAALGIAPGTVAGRILKMRSQGYEIPIFEKTRTPGKYDPEKFRRDIRGREDKKAAEDLKRQLYTAQEKVKILEYAHEHEGVVRINPAPRGKKRPAVAVAMGSDQHIEEEVDPATVNGKNAYNLQIAERRMKRWAQGIVWKTKHHMNSYDIRSMLLCLMGDFISGFIHPELVETGQLAPGPALVWWVKRMRGVLDLLLREFPEMRFDLPCVVGNHERTTDKIRIATRVENSFGYLAYTMLASHYANEPRVQFQIAAGAHAYAEVWAWTLRITHGDDIRYNGGVGGLMIPLRKSCDAWNETFRADYTLIGHYHQHTDMSWAVANGSLIGYSPFAQWVKGRYEPPSQAYFLIDAERGKSCVDPIWVDTQGARPIP